jgi:hypothetical protein
MDDYFAEQFPLSPADDYLIHQTPDPIRVMWSSDPRAYDRYWTVFHDDAGELVVATGGSFYPNLDLAEAYAIVNYRGDHRSVRAFRRLGADRMDLHCGPIQPAIVRGMRLWRYVLEDNEWGITYNVHFHDTTRQVYREPAGSYTTTWPPGRRPDVTTGFEGFGEVEGWVQIDGARLELHRSTCRGTRDRHWGIGRNVGGPASEQHTLSGKPAPQSFGFSGNNFVAFSDYAIWGDRIFYYFGDPRPGMGRVAKTQRRLRFEPDTHIFVEGFLDYTLTSGEVRQVHYERIGNQTAYMRCGMYGGTADKGIHQGTYVGDNVVEGDRHDVNDPSARAHLAGLDEHQCRVTCDGETVVGIYQPIDPDAYHACLEGREGWSFL